MLAERRLLVQRLQIERYKSGHSASKLEKAAVENFARRLEAALNRRLAPHTALHFKEAAAEIGRSVNSLKRWCNGTAAITAEDFYSLAALFARRGDFRFVSDAFGELAQGIQIPLEGKEALIVLARAVLIRAGELSAVDQHTHTWFTDDGNVATAPKGLAGYVRQKLKLGHGGDLPSFATRVLGWVGVTERSDGVVIIRHDGRNIAPLAAERICGWLDDRAEMITHVNRLIQLKGDWIQAHHMSARGAAEAIAKVALLMRVARRAWHITRLRPDTVTGSLLIRLLSIYAESPSKIVHVAAETGAFTTSSLFGVDGENVISHHVPTAFGFDPKVEGLNVLSRADTEYAMMIRSRILLTKQEGLTYYELEGTIDDRNARYFNLAFSEPGPSGRVLTSSDVKQLDPIAA